MSPTEIQIVGYKPTFALKRVSSSFQKLFFFYILQDTDMKPTALRKTHISDRAVPRTLGRKKREAGAVEGAQGAARWIRENKSLRQCLLWVSIQYRPGFHDDLESPAGPVQAEVRGLLGSGEKKVQEAVLQCGKYPKKKKLPSVHFWVITTFFSPQFQWPISLVSPKVVLLQCQRYQKKIVCVMYNYFTLETLETLIRQHVVLLWKTPAPNYTDTRYQSHRVQTLCTAGWCSALH